MAFRELLCSLGTAEVGGAHARGRLWYLRFRQGLVIDNEIVFLEFHQLTTKGRPHPKVPGISAAQG